VNAWWEPLDVVIPELPGTWHTAVDTFAGEVRPAHALPEPALDPGDVRKVGPRTLVVLRSLTKM
jgi:hypothetical protein